MMKLSDYVAEFIAQQGTSHVFGLTGGAVVHLFDSVERHSKLQAVFCHHEQAGSFAAEAHAKYTGKLGVGFFTTGPGVTNAITGLAAAWLDSIPCLFISGQARLSHTTQGKPIRQLGAQQLDIIPIVQSLTKYAAMVTTAQEIRFHLEKAVKLATTGRPGPVWIDIPLDLQWAMIEPEHLQPYDDESLVVDQSVELSQLKQVVADLQKASRPVVLAGYGVRLAQAESLLAEFVQKTKIPLLTTWGAADIYPSDDSLYLGRPGLAGQRGANLTMQNADYILAIGTHLNIPTTGTNFSSFARDAKIVVVSNDANELKHQTVRVDQPIVADAKVFLQGMLLQLKEAKINSNEIWKSFCIRYRELNACPKLNVSRGVSQYEFVDQLSEFLTAKNPVVVDGGGTNVYIAYHALRLKAGQRMILSTGLCSMGSGLPEAIGVAMANSKQNTICLCGDGSFQLNIQELQTIVHHQLPIKIFIFNNGGYVSIRQTQDGFLDGRHFGSTKSGGMSVPNILEVTKGYGIKTFLIETKNAMINLLPKVLAESGPVLCEVLVPTDQIILPTQGFDKQPNGTVIARPLEDMAPYLPREEFISLMITSPLEVSKNG